MARASRTFLLALGVGLVLCLVLALGADPGAGTGTNLQPISDVGAQVAGEHHAKPLPRSGTVVVALVLLVVAAAGVLALTARGPQLVDAPAAEAVDGVRRSVEPVRREQVVGRSAAPRRGPPALLPV